VVNAAAGANRAIVVNHLVCILFMVNTYILFTFIDFEHRQFRLMALASLAGMSAIAFTFSVNGVFYLGALGIARDAESLATYQGFARSYLMTFLPVVAHTRSLPLRLVLYGTGAATLFINTARSEFAALLFAIPIIEFYFSRHKMIFIMVATVLFHVHLFPPGRDRRVAAGQPHPRAAGPVAIDLGQQAPPPDRVRAPDHRRPPDPGRLRQL
jgi:hypothetical protein